MAVVLAPVGIAVALSRRAEVERWVGALRPPEVAGGIGVPGIALATQVTPPLIVDTSAIIDGRLPSVAAAGFLPSALVVPRFVLDELRRVADDAEPLRRQRGRRGLEALAKLQEDGHAQIQIAEEDFPEAADVDAKLLALARVRRGALLTTNANLSRVAKVEQIHVLNFNALAEAMHVQLLPGELLQVQVQQEGRERRQGVGYLEDGTMVVIEEGRELLGEDVAVEVQRVIHTSAGRMVFRRGPGGEPGPRGAGVSGGRAAAILLAAGRSTRMRGLEKTLASLGGLPIAAHSLRTFAACLSIDAIVIVSSSANHSTLTQLAAEHGAGKVAAVVLGGTRRQDSVAQGLRALPPCDLVAVHDTARPAGHDGGDRARAGAGGRARRRCRRRAGPRHREGRRGWFCAAHASTRPPLDRADAADVHADPARARPRRSERRR